MINMPKFTSYSVADPSSNKVMRATEIEVERRIEIDDITKEELTIETSNVRISEEAFDKIRIERQLAAIENRQTGTDTLNLSAGLKINNPNILSEEESKALLDSLIEDPMSKTLREIGERLQVVDNVTVELQVASEALEQTYSSLMKGIQQDRPDLANKDFGFSIDTEGAIVLRNTDSLNAEQIGYLEHALNNSSTLLKQAADVANAHVALSEAEWWHKSVTLNRENYAKTIDLGADLSYRRAAKALPRGTDYIPATPINVQDYWRNQLSTNGERTSTAWKMS